MIISIFTIKGDYHDKGKNEVRDYLISGGFDVFDWGKNLSIDLMEGLILLEEPDIICISSTLSTTYDYLVNVVETLKRFYTTKVIVGGSILTQNLDLTELKADKLVSSKEDLLEYLRSL